MSLSIVIRLDRPEESSTGMHKVFMVGLVLSIKRQVITTSHPGLAVVVRKLGNQHMTPVYRRLPIIRTNDPKRFGPRCCCREKAHRGSMRSDGIGQAMAGES